MLSLALLGPFQAHFQERPLTQFKSTKAQALLVYLAVESQSLGAQRQRMHQREALMSLLWPDLPVKSAQQSLRQTLYLLRQTIESEETETPFILAERFTIGWNPEAPFWLDVGEFEYLSGLGRSPEEWRQAADLYRGDFLADFYVADSEAFEEWANGRRAAYQRTAQELLQRLAGHYIGQHDFLKAETAARRNLELDFFQETAQRQLMEALAGSGRRQEALTQFDAFSHRLGEEFGVEPEDETAGLVVAIRAGQFSPEQAAHLEPVMVFSEGEGIPRQQSLSSNLPTPPTAFIGRETELAAIDELMNGDDARLITIVGPGGMGKTRLALAWAANQLPRQNGHVIFPFQHGVHFLNLAPLPTADLIVPTLANVLNFPIKNSSDRERRSPKQQILDYLSQKQMLLLMDNFEHLLEGADLVVDILDATAEVKILVTSRERLNLRQEQVYPIQGLEFPDWETPEDAAEYTAVQLFLQSAKRNLPDFVLTGGDDLTYLARICRLVAGMPLAIELAAAWVEMLSLDEIAAEIQRGLDILETELRDVPPRQRSIRATIDYSWQKLTENEREIFTKLAVFRGGFTRDAAREISGASLRELSHLQNKSLLQVDREGHRYQLHELLRQYAAEKLAVDMELKEAVNGRHARYYARFLADQESLLAGPQETETLQRLDQERENIDAAWQWLVANKEAPPLLDCISSYVIYHMYRIRIQAGVARCHQIIDWCRSPADNTERLLLVRALNWHSILSMNFLFDSSQVEAYLTWAARELEKLSDSGFNLDNDWGFNHYFYGQFLQPGVMTPPESLERFEKALELFKKSGNQYSVVRTLQWLYWARFYGSGDKNGYKAALELCEQALNVVRAMKSNRLMTDLVANIGTLALQAGDMPLMIRFMEEVEKALIRLKERGTYADREELLERYAWMLLVSGQVETALEKHLEFHVLRRELGLPVHAVTEFQYSQMLAHLGRYDEAKKRSEISMALVRQQPNDWILGLILINTGMIAIATGELETAEAALRQGLLVQEKIDNGQDLSGNLANLGLSLCRQERYAEAKPYLLSSLQLAIGAHAYLPLIEVLPGIALALAHSEPSRPEQTAEIYGLLMSQAYYANSRLFHDMSGRFIQAFLDENSSEAVQLAMEQSGGRDIWEEGARLLENLKEIWVGD